MSANYPHRDSIDRFVACLASQDPLLVVLFGSVASGDFTENSDADIVVVFTGSKSWNQVYACSDGWVQPIVLSLPELRHRLIEGDSFVHEILEGGELLSGAAELWQDLQQSARDTQLRLGMKRQSRSWSYNWS